jgi:anti-sigma-K factor RskA
MVHTLLDLPPADWAVVTDALFLKWQQPERMRTATGQRLRASDRHKAVRRNASCRCDCRRSWGCVHLRENRKRNSVVDACGLWYGTQAFFAVVATLASPVGGMWFSTYIGARVAIVGYFMGCG